MHECKIEITKVYTSWAHPPHHILKAFGENVLKSALHQEVLTNK